MKNSICGRQQLHKVKMLPVVNIIPPHLITNKSKNPNIKLILESLTNVSDYLSMMYLYEKLRNFRLGPGIFGIHLKCHILFNFLNFFDFMVVNTSIMNVGVQMSSQNIYFISFEYSIPSSGMLALYGSPISYFLKKLHAVFPNGCIFLPPTNSCEISLNLQHAGHSQSNICTLESPVSSAISQTQDDE